MFSSLWVNTYVHICTYHWAISVRIIICRRRKKYVMRTYVLTYSRSDLTSFLDVSFYHWKKSPRAGWPDCQSLFPNCHWKGSMSLIQGTSLNFPVLSAIVQLCLVPEILARLPLYIPFIGMVPGHKNGFILAYWWGEPPEMRISCFPLVGREGTHAPQELQQNSESCAAMIHSK